MRPSPRVSTDPGPAAVLARAARRLLPAVLLVALGGAASAQADTLGRGAAAFDRGDYVRAAQELSPLAARGNARALGLLGFMMPKSVVRLSAGRQYMSDELQALCFLAGANSIFIGDVLLTTTNPQRDRDANLLERLGMTSGFTQGQVAQSDLKASASK